MISTTAKAHRNKCVHSTKNNLNLQPVANLIGPHSAKCTHNINVHIPEVNLGRNLNEGLTHISTSRVKIWNGIEKNGGRNNTHRFKCHVFMDEVTPVPEHLSRILECTVKSFATYWQINL